MNTQPMRVLFLRSAEAKARIKPALMPTNVDKVMATPVVAVIAYDTEFHTQLPNVFPHNPNPNSQGWDKLMDIACYVGVDVSKDRLDVHVRPGATAFAVANTAAGVAELADHLAPLRVEKVILEASGGYEKRAFLLLIEAGHPVAIVNPRQVRDFAKGAGRVAKTDTIDAAVLAHFAEVFRPRNTTVVSTGKPGGRVCGLPPVSYPGDDRRSQPIATPDDPVASVDPRGTARVREGRVQGDRKQDGHAGPAVRQETVVRSAHQCARRRARSSPAR